MLFVVTPLYVLGMIESIVFTIYFSPSVTLTSETQVEDLTLASDLISNFIYACISATVLGLGLKKEYWRTPGKRRTSFLPFRRVNRELLLSGVCFVEQVVALANLGAAPAGRYLNLEDNASQK